MSFAGGKPMHCISFDVEEHTLQRFRDPFDERGFQRAFHLFDESHALREVAFLAGGRLRDQPPELRQVETHLLRRGQERFHVVDESKQHPRGFPPFGNEHCAAPRAHSREAFRQSPRGRRLAGRDQTRQRGRDGRGILSLLEVSVARHLGAGGVV